MDNIVSKSKFKPHALEYFRQVEKSGKELLITDHGRPVLRIVPYAQSTEEVLRRLRGSVVKFDDPTAPIDVEWESQR